MKKVHITLAPEVGKDSERAGVILTALIEKHGLENVDKSRFKRFGIISGDVAEDQMQAIREIKGIKSVTLDGEKGIMSR